VCRGVNCQLHYQTVEVWDRESSKCVGFIMIVVYYFIVCGVNKGPFGKIGIFVCFLENLVRSCGQEAGMGS